MWVCGLPICVHSADSQPFKDNNVTALLIFDYNIKDPHADWKYGAKDSTGITHIAHIQHIAHIYMSVLLIIRFYYDVLGIL